MRISTILTAKGKNLVVYFASQSSGMKQLLAAALEANSDNDKLKILASEWSELEFAPIDLPDAHPHQTILVGDHADDDRAESDKATRDHAEGENECRWR